MNKLKAKRRYVKLDVDQAVLKARLHENLRQYYSYRVLLKRGKKVLAPVTLHYIKNQQREINIIRKQINKKPIRLVQEMQARLKLL